MSWLLDHTPWWAWLALAAGGGGAILAFVPGALAAVVSVWSLMPRPVKVALAAIAGGIGLYLAGRNKGTKDAAERRAQDNAAAVGNRTEVDREVSRLDRTDTDNRLDRWMRDDR